MYTPFGSLVHPFRGTRARPSLTFPAIFLHVLVFISQRIMPIVLSVEAWLGVHSLAIGTVFPPPAVRRSFFPKISVVPTLPSFCCTHLIHLPNLVACFARNFKAARGLVYELIWWGRPPYFLPASDFFWSPPPFFF